AMVREALATGNADEGVGTAASGNALKIYSGVFCNNDQDGVGVPRTDIQLKTTLNTGENVLDSVFFNTIGGEFDDTTCQSNMAAGFPCCPCSDIDQVRNMVDY
ncbi:MAG: hypothetical protein SGARI_006805, partial [Bacillariaceae sp.]